MDAVRRLAIEDELRRLKARYFLHLDRKEWDAWGQVFTIDAVMDVSAQFPDAPDPSVHVLRGRDAIVSSVRHFLADTATAHHGHTPLIDVDGEEAAHGLWAMEDNLFFSGGGRMIGWGHYEEEYRVADGAWRIARTRLTRIRVLHLSPDPAGGG